MFWDLKNLCSVCFQTLEARFTAIIRRITLIKSLLLSKPISTGSANWSQYLYQSFILILYILYCCVERGELIGKVRYGTKLQIPLESIDVFAELKLHRFVKHDSFGGLQVMLFL